MKTYITFGQIHTHRINNETLDCDCVAAIEHDADTSGHKIAMRLFDAKFHNAYPEDQFDADKIMPYYSRGIIEIGYHE